MTLPPPAPPKFRTYIRHLFRRLVKPVTRERRADVQVQLRQAAHPDFPFFLLVILSSVIATSGLLTDSAAVIIGAMLVAPLMSPIIGLGLASLTGDEKLMQDSAIALGRGAILAILLSILLTWGNRLMPFITLQELPSEVLARTHPSPLDLTIALAGGLAAAFALAHPALSATLPGVAIATALMPPLCTVGIGVAMSRWDVAGGALLLFVTNAVTIAFAAMLIFFLLGFTPHYETGRRIPRSLVVTALFTVILFVPLAFLSAQFVRQAGENRAINTIVTEEVAKYNAELTELKVNATDNVIRMTITVRTAHAFSYQDVTNLQQEIALRLQKPVAIVVNQIFAASLDPLIPPTFTPTATPATLTPTPSYTPTITLTPTITSTPIPPTPTPTPALAKIANPYNFYVDLLQSPGGPAIARLWQGNRVLVLYGVEVAEGLVWLEVQDSDGRIGWVPQIYLAVLTLTPSPTQPVTPTPNP